MKSKIIELHNKIINREIDISKYVESLINKLESVKHTNSYINDTFAYAKETAKSLTKEIDKNKDNLLFAIPYGNKDNISTKGIITTGGSLFLKDYVPPFDATVTKILKDAKTIMMCKTNLDEFGLGGTGTFSAYGTIKNILDQTRIAGGSSSGSVNLVASGILPFATGTDTGDSVRRPSSFVGTVGYKPTYGLISRYGVLPYAPSLDHVGVIASYVTDCAIVASQLIQYDEKDFTSQKLEKHDLYKNLTLVKKISIGVIKGVEEFLSKEVKQPYLDLLKNLSNQGFEIKYLSFDIELMKAISSMYAAVSYAEAVSCWSNLTGITFGNNFGGKNYEEIITKARTVGLGNQIKQRFILGTYITKTENFDKLFLNSQKVRRLFVNRWTELLNSVDTILLPGASSVAPKIDDINNNVFHSTYADDLLCIPNFAGTPSITIPYTKVNNLPFGINLNCKQFEDQKLLNIALTLEETLMKGKHE